MSLTQQKPPVFRSKVDLMQLDVTVLDKKGQPVRGLTQADFTLLEDDKPQSIQGFTAVDLPDRVTGGPVWESKVLNDVATNQIDNQRIVILMLDDALGIGLWGKREMKASATKLVESLGPKDLAAVVFTGATYRNDQNLTLDRARLIKALNSYPDLDGNLLFPPAPDPGGARPRSIGVGYGPCEQRKDLCCMAYKEVLKLFEGVVNHLSTLPNRRKAIIYFGSNLPWEPDPTGDPCGTYFMWRDVFAAAQLAHVTVNPVNTNGLLGKIPEHYLAVAENTGGHAVIQSNDFMPGIRQILVENSSYYLLAFQPDHVEDDGRFRRLTVRVNRKDVEVHTRRGYWAPKAKETATAAPPSPSVEALAGVLPLADLSLRATAVPFFVDGRVVVAMAVGVLQPAFPGRTSEQVELLVKAFTADGDPRGSDDQLIPIVVPAPAAGADVSRYEILSRLELAGPGKYEFRLSAHSAASDKRGSIYVDVEVPDFQKEKVSLSGVIVNNVASSTPVAPLRVLRDVSALTPTTERAFAAADLVTTFMRVYQGGTDKLAPLTMKVSIVDAAGKAVVSQTDTIAVDRFSADRAADFQYRLPLSTLTAGEYLLTFEAAVGKTTARRDLRFEKRSQ